jgi:hypothetical protein
MRERFTLTTVEETIYGSTLAGDDDVCDYDQTDVSDAAPADLTDVLRALDSQCWDHVDWADDRIVAYPADGHDDYRTGDHSRTTLIVGGKPHQLERVLSLRKEL